MCCAACSCLTSCLACGVCGACNKEYSNTSRLPYVLLFVISIVIALVLSFYGAKEIGEVFGWTIKLCNSDSCLGNQAVFRITFCLFVFFLFHACFMLCGDDAANLHGQFWGIKILLYLLFILVSFWIPNEFFSGYAEVARVVSIVFLVIQVIVLILSTYEISEKWVAKMEDNRAYVVLFLVCAFSGLIISVIFWGFFFTWFAPNGDPNCVSPEKDRNAGLIAVMIIFSVIHTIIAGSKWCEHGSLLCSSVVTMYTTFLLYSSLYADPSGCNTLGSSRTDPEKWIGLLWASLSVSWSAYKIASFNKMYRQQEVLNDDVELQEKQEKAAEGEVEDNQWSDEELIMIRKINRNFHLLMACGAMYSAMLLSNWGTDIDNLNEGDTNQVDFGVRSLWVKTSASWLCILLYLWTLLADKALPMCGREL